jgi:hypothetical protein
LKGCLVRQLFLLEAFSKTILLPISSLKNISKCSFTPVNCAFSVFFVSILFALIVFEKASIILNLESKDLLTMR